MIPPSISTLSQQRNMSNVGKAEPEAFADVIRCGNDLFNSRRIIFRNPFGERREEFDVCFIRHNPAMLLSPLVLIWLHTLLLRNTVNHCIAIYTGLCSCLIDARI